MDDLLDNMTKSFQVTKSENSIYSKHPRFGQFKQRSGKSGDQNVRRQDFLKKQKDRRCDFVNHIRCLVIGEWEEEEKDTSDNMEVTEEKFRPPKRYKDQLMLSEWLVEVPDDFKDEWTMLVCPIGKRNLVVAAKGRTSCYSKSGYCIDTFASVLPGGSYETSAGYTVLDCIYSQLEQTFYVLDIMCWNDHPVYNSETEFRFYWLESKFQETPKLASVSENNTYKFLNLSKYTCTNDQILAALNKCNPISVDGLLFYHKRTHYTFGTTPLVTWLKPYMVKEIFGITPPEAYANTSGT